MIRIKKVGCKNMKKRILVISIILIILCISGIGVTYSLWNISVSQDGVNTATTKCFNVEIISQNNNISLENAYPITNEKGKKLTPFSFTITNTCDIFASYTVSLESLKGTTLSSKFLNAMINNEEIKKLSDYEVTDTVNTGSIESHILAKGSLGSGDSEDYTLRVWIDYDTTMENLDNETKTFKSKVVVKAEPSSWSPVDEGYTTLHDAILANEYQTSPEVAIKKIEAKGTPDLSKTAPISEDDLSDKGLYKSEDDYGNTYYYRGKVSNNYVSFADSIWQIIRINGDGSIKLIYSGKSTLSQGLDSTIEISKFNTQYNDPAYSGYMYGTSFSLHDNNNSPYFWYESGKDYLFSTTYDFNKTTKKFELTGEIKTLNWQEDKSEIIINNLYTCFAKKCDVIYKIVGEFDSRAILAKSVSYSSDDYESTLKNTKNSNVKNILDEWYQNNLINYTSYLSDEIFCNDRSVYEGTGYKIDTNTFYGAHYRISSNNKPSLLCQRETDSFNTVNSFAMLDYPIGLITADEVAIAGGVNNISNFEFYLNKNIDFWTMSPSYYDSGFSVARFFYVIKDGTLHNGSLSSNDRGIRPVINLRADVEITGGIGTKNSPYVIKTN